MISFEHKGNFAKLTRYFEKIKDVAKMSALNKAGQDGVNALASATPVDSGLTANSWSYDIKQSAGLIEISFKNSHVNKGVNIALILQYGHGTRNGGYVQGRDYINPALQPVFDKIVDELWREVTSA